MKKINYEKLKEFNPLELSEAAYTVYVNSSFNVTINIIDNLFSIYDGDIDRSNKFGSGFTLQDVEDFLLQFVEEVAE